MHESKAVALLDLDLYCHPQVLMPTVVIAVTNEVLFICV